MMPIWQEIYSPMDIKMNIANEARVLEARASN